MAISGTFKYDNLVARCGVRPIMLAILSVVMSAGEPTNPVSVYAECVPNVAPTEVIVNMVSVEPTKVSVAPGFRYRLQLVITADELVGSTIQRISATCGCIVGGDAEVLPAGTVSSTSLKMTGNTFIIKALIAAPDEACSLQHSVTLTVLTAKGETMDIVRPILIQSESQAYVRREGRIFPSVDVSAAAVAEKRDSGSLRINTRSKLNLIPSSVPGIKFSSSDSNETGVQSWIISYEGIREFSGGVIYPYYIGDASATKLACGYIQIMNRATGRSSPTFSVISLGDLPKRPKTDVIASFIVTPGQETDPAGSINQRPATAIVGDFARIDKNESQDNFVLTIVNTQQFQDSVAKTSVVNLWVDSDPKMNPVCIPLIIK